MGQLHNRRSENDRNKSIVDELYHRPPIDLEVRYNHNKRKGSVAKHEKRHSPIYPKRVLYCNSLLSFIIPNSSDLISERAQDLVGSI